MSEIVATPPIVGTKQSQIWLALGALYLIWGSTYLAIRVALEAFPPLQLAGVRFVIAGGALLGWQHLRGARFPTLREWRSSLIIGVLLIGGNTLVTAAEQWVSSGLTAVAIGSVPLWVGLLSGLFGRWPARNEWLALGVGFAGVMLLNLGGELRGQPLGAALLLLSALVWSLGSILSGRLPKASGLSGTGALMLCGGVLDLLIALIIKESRPHDVTFRAVFSFFWLVIPGSIVAFSTFTWLLGKVRPTLATSYAYVNPVVAVGLGALILNEPITGTSLGAMALILLGVGLLARAKTA